MRKSEMSLKQRENRKKFIDILTEANWCDEGIPEENFDKDYWVQNEAAFVYLDPDSRDLDALFHAENNAIKLTFLAQNFCVFLEILYYNEIESVLTEIIKYQDKIKDHYKDFLSELLKNEKIKVILGKGTKLIPLTKKIIEQIDHPPFKEVRYEDFAFYLAGQIESSFFLSKDNLKLAHKRCIEYIINNSEKFLDWKTLIKTKSLAELFYEHNLISTKFDDEGNMIKVFQGGDSFEFELLEEIREYVAENSYFLFQDDLLIFWKVIYTKEKVLYYKEDF